MPAKKPNLAIKLFGTTVPDSKGRLLRAGPLSAILDNGALRYVRLNDVEVLRAIAFLVRDENWGTSSPEIAKLAVKQGKSGFEVTYEARCADAKRALTYKAHITATADGSLRFDATALPHTDFLTNRAGFVVLHPLKGVAGRPVEILHVDGRTGEGRVSGRSSIRCSPSRHPRPQPRSGAGRRGDVPHGRRHLRDGGPPQLDRRLVQDLCPAIGADVALHAAGGQRDQAIGELDARR